MFSSSSINMESRSVRCCWADRPPLEQQAAISAALTSPEMRQNARNIDTLDSSDIVNAEDLVKLLNPLKTATTVLCEEKSPTVSLIVPLKIMIEQSMAPNDGDSPTVADTKRAILSNISGRYSGDVYNILLESTALDPRFQTLPQLDHNQRESVFLSVQKKAEQLQQNQTTGEKSTEREEAAAHCSTHGGEGALGVKSEEEEPASKKSALEHLLGDSFSKTEKSSRGTEKEIDLYRREALIPLSCCVLKWWRENSSKYPLLSPLAKAYLSIPATSVPTLLVDGLLSVVHITDDGMSILEPLKITDTHVVVKVPHLSAFGLIWDFVRRFLNISPPIEAQVLLFLRSLNIAGPVLNVLLLPGNIPLNEVKMQYEDAEHIQIPSYCDVSFGQSYSVHCVPEVHKIQPESAPFRLRYGPNYHPTFQVLLETIPEKVTLMFQDRERREVLKCDVRLREI